MPPAEALENLPTTPSRQRASAPDVLIRVTGASKKYCRSLKKSLWYGVKDIAQELNPFLRQPRLGSQPAGPASPAELRDDEFWALRDISFEVRRGECLGLIGHNGAGKTTLLKMLNGLIKPDRGRIEMHGRVGAMIALGAGFNPILTGRENIYVNASILGLEKKEIDRKLPEIVDFAEMHEFIDAPVQSYSSGMQVRLGFAVATAVQPDILILDEVLAVGDTRFRQKSLNRIRSLIARSAVIFVSHSEQDVRKIATSALLLSRGQNLHLGGLHEAYTKYSTEATREGGLSQTPDTYENGLSLKRIECLPQEVVPGNCLTLHMKVCSQRSESGCAVRLILMGRDGARLAEWNSHFHQKTFDFAPGPQTIEVTIDRVMLIPGRYALAIEISDSSEQIKFKRLNAGVITVAAALSSKVQCAVQF